MRIVLLKWLSAIRAVSTSARHATKCAWSMIMIVCTAWNVIVENMELRRTTTKKMMMNMEEKLKFGKV